MTKFIEAVDLKRENSNDQNVERRFEIWAFSDCRLPLPITTRTTIALQNSCKSHAHQPNNMLTVDEREASFENFSSFLCSAVAAQILTLMKRRSSKLILL